MSAVYKIFQKVRCTLCSLSAERSQARRSGRSPLGLFPAPPCPNQTGKRLAPFRRLASTRKMRAHYKTEKHKQPIGAESRTCNRMKTLRTLQNKKTRGQKMHRTLSAHRRNTKTHQTNRCKNHTMTNATCPKLKAHAGDDLDCTGSPRAHCRLKYKILQTTDRR